MAVCHIAMASRKLSRSCRQAVSVTLVPGLDRGIIPGQAETGAQVTETCLMNSSKRSAASYLLLLKSTLDCNSCSDSP